MAAAPPPRAPAARYAAEAAAVDAFSGSWDWLSFSWFSLPSSPVHTPAMTQHFSLADCDVVGFDLDHTLCRYNLQESASLIYNSFAQYLVTEKGYHKELLTVPPESWDFCCRGLALDLEEGNFIKLAVDGTVLRASHGTKMMTSEELMGIFGKKKWKHFTDSLMASRAAKYYFFDNFFDLPGALLCARIVDYLTREGNQSTFDFWKDVLASIHYNYKITAFKATSIN